MNLRSILLIVLALVMVGGTVFFAKNWLENQRAQVAGEPEPKPKEITEVLVAKTDLPAGTILTAEHLNWQAWPEGNLSQGYMVRRSKSDSSQQKILGALVRQGIASGQPITSARITKPGDRSFLAAVLQPGYRAVSIAIDSASGLAGLVVPGDRVDIILTHVIFEPGSGDKVEHRASETVLTNVRVLALDQKIDNSGGAPKQAKTATLEVSPKQAEVVAVSRELGSLSLSLRSLAMDQEELDRLAKSDDPFAQSQPDYSESYTWDNQASGLVAARTQRVETEEESVMVSQGSSISKQIYREGGMELQQLTPTDSDGFELPALPKESAQ